MNYLQSAANAVKSGIPVDQLPDGDLDSLFRIYAVLMFAKGVAVTNRDVHNAWVAWMAQREPDHESLIPYDELDPATKDEDSVFTLAIRSAARDLP